MNNKFTPYLIATTAIIIFAIAGLLKIINIPSLGSIFYQRLIFSTAVAWTTLAPLALLLQSNKDNVVNNQLASLNEFESRQHELLKTLTPLLENKNLSESQIAHQIRSLPEFGKKTSPKTILQNQPKKKINIAQNQNVNLILIAIARHVVAMKPIKFNGKDDAIPNQLDATFFIDAQNIELSASIYLREALRNPDIFGNDLSYKRFLSKLLADNDFFLEGLSLDLALRKNLENGLLKFNRALDVADTEEARPNKSQDVPSESYSKLTAPDQVLDKKIISDETEVLKPPHHSDLISLSARVDLALDSTITVDEIIAKTRESLATHALEDYLELTNHGKKIELKTTEESPPIFRKILHQRTDGRAFLGPTELDSIYPKIITEYQNTEEYHDRQKELQSQQRQFEARQPLERALEIVNQPLQRDALARWGEFVSQETKREFELRHYRKFADFLNNSSYLRSFAEIGEVRLKGSYLYGDLLNLKPITAPDIDLEIYIPDLFSDTKSPTQIKELIEKHLGFLVGENIRISKRYSYVQFELKTEDGTMVDLSFYDSNKLSTNDWIYSLDALRMDLTDTLKLGRPIKDSDLLSQETSLANGFTRRYPQTKVDQVLFMTENRFQLVNFEARDLFFNTLRRIKKGVLEVGQVHSLYANNDQFKEALDLDAIPLLNAGLEKLPDKYENAGINAGYLREIFEQIVSGDLSQMPTAITSKTTGISLQKTQTITKQYEYA